MELRLFSTACTGSLRGWEMYSLSFVPLLFLNHSANNYTSFNFLICHFAPFQLLLGIFKPSFTRIFVADMWMTLFGWWVKINRWLSWIFFLIRLSQSPSDFQGCSPDFFPTFKRIFYSIIASVVLFYTYVSTVYFIFGNWN